MYFNPTHNQFEFEVGDEVWVVPGYCGDMLIAVKTTIVGIDESFREKNPLGNLFYYIDEPYPFPLMERDLFSKIEAIKELRKRFQEEFEDVGSACANALLNEYRHSTECFIRDSWEEMDSHPGFPERTEKVLGVDWFNFASLKDMKG